MSDTLSRLYATILARKGGDPETSYAARLLKKGTAKIAQKVGEEAVETALAAVLLETGAGNRKEVVAEATDLLFHLWLLLAACGIDPTEVIQEIERRQGISGLDEKKGRKG